MNANTFSVLRPNDLHPVGESNTLRPLWTSEKIEHVLHALAGQTLQVEVDSQTGFMVTGQIVGQITTGSCGTASARVTIQTEHNLTNYPLGRLGVIVSPESKFTAITRMHNTRRAVRDYDYGLNRAGLWPEIYGLGDCRYRITWRSHDMKTQKYTPVHSAEIKVNEAGQVIGYSNTRVWVYWPATPSVPPDQPARGHYAVPMTTDQNRPNQLRAVKLQADQIGRGTFELDGVDLTRSVAAVSLQTQAGQPTRIVVETVPNAIEFEGFATVELATYMNDPGPAAAEFLSAIDPEILEKTALARLDLDAKPAAATRAIIRQLIEWAEGR